MIIISTDLLNDSNYGINKNDSYKHGVFVGTNQQYENQQHQVQKIEECQCILHNDLFICPGVWIFIRINLALLDPLIYLFVCKSCQLFTSQSATVINTLLPLPLHPHGCQTSVSSDLRSQCDASVRNPTVQHVQPPLQEENSVLSLAEVRPEPP